MLPIWQSNRQNELIGYLMLYSFGIFMLTDSTPRRADLGVDYTQLYDTYCIFTRRLASS